jgi:2-methylcitrate dehydratase
MLKTLSRSSNQALELGKFAIEFFKTAVPSHKVVERVKLFHTDSVMCGLSALALKTNAPSVLKEEATSVSKKYRSSKLHPGYSKCFGSYESVPAEKAVLANCSAVREWDSNGTVFGYNSNKPNHQAGEFGHNDFYPVVISAAQQNPLVKGKDLVNGFILVDEIRGRLAEVFSLKSYKIDHVVHGAIASICTYGAMRGATAEQIEHAIGMFVAHYIPYRAIRAGHQLSDSKGASAAISAEAAIMCMHRAMNGFIGPKDIFRNPEAIFRLNEKTNGDSPFDIDLCLEGDDFSVMGMHFKLGLYEHQSAGALEGLLRIVMDKHHQLTFEDIDSIKIVAYEPAFGIIGDPHKRNPTTRQSADHSMVYIGIYKKIFDYKMKNSFNFAEQSFKTQSCRKTLSNFG